MPICLIFFSKGCYKMRNSFCNYNYEIEEGKSHTQSAIENLWTECNWEMQPSIFSYVMMHDLFSSDKQFACADTMFDETLKSDVRLIC